MTVIQGDAVEVMAGMEPDSVDAICTDPPYGLEFMGKEWDRLGDHGQISHAGPDERDATTPYGRTRVGFYGSQNRKCRACGHWQWSGKPCRCDTPDFPQREHHQGLLMQAWHEQWAAAVLRVARPGAYLLAFGGTRTVHRMTCALEDAGWVIRDMLVWAYAQGFPKSRASLKPAYEPIVLCRKPGASRDLNIDAARIGTTKDVPASLSVKVERVERDAGNGYGYGQREWKEGQDPNVGRWPANVILTDPIFDGGWEGVVGGGETRSGLATRRSPTDNSYSGGWPGSENVTATYGDSGTYSRFFMLREEVVPVTVAGSGQESSPAQPGTARSTDESLPTRFLLVPKAPTSERVLSDGRRSPHPTQKPEALIRHLVKLVTPAGGLVLDPFLGSGTLGVVCDGLGIRWLGIERDPEYAQWAQDRLADFVNHGLGLIVPEVVIPKPQVERGTHRTRTDALIWKSYQPDEDAS